MGERIRQVQHPMLGRLLVISSMLAVFEVSLQDVFAIDTSTLIALGSQLEQVDALAQHLRKLEDMIKSFVVWSAEGDRRLTVLARTQEEFLPHMRAARDHAESIIVELKALNIKLRDWKRVARPSRGNVTLAPHI